MPFGWERRNLDKSTDDTKPTNRIYVDVVSVMQANGFVRPLELTWKDGTKYKIERLIDVQNMSSLKAGGKGRRYKVMICGKQRYLYCDGDRWYV